jgi:F0F1-type ATP synthase assembly protein I
MLLTSGGARSSERFAAPTLALYIANGFTSARQRGRRWEHQGSAELSFDTRAKQQLNRGYSDGMARGMEAVLAPLLLGAIGWLLDGWLGTEPVLAVAFGLFGAAGIFVKLKLGYDRQMTEVEAGKPWTRTAPSGVDEAGA